MDAETLALLSLARIDSEVARHALQRQSQAWWEDMCTRTEVYDAAVEAAASSMPAEQAEKLRRVWDILKAIMKTNDEDEERHRLEAELQAVGDAPPHDVNWIAPLVEAYDQWMPDDVFLHLHQCATTSRRTWK